MKAIITVGISASGKTTWARAQVGFHVVSRDDHRWDIMTAAGLVPCWKNWKWKWEDKVTAAVDQALSFHASEGANVIIADTNLNAAHRVAMEKKLRGLGYDVEVKVFNITYDEAVLRDNARPNGVGASVIQKQHQQFLDNYGTRVVQNRNLPEAAIIDIDGTVAHMGGHRGPFEWSKVGLDDPNHPVIAMVGGLAASGKHLVFTSGRDAVCRPETTAWLLKNIPALSLQDWTLLMREENDQRKDTIVKEEIFRRDILPNFFVTVVLDDRPSVCRMWRDLGLNVVQVGNPYIEF